MTTFKDLRERRGYTTSHTAKLLGIKVETYRKYECFVCLPCKDILFKMADVYKCNFEEIFNAYQIGRKIKDERKARKRN